MIEPEMAFCDLNGYMDNAEAMIKYVIRYVLDNCPDEMAFFNQFIDKGLVERLELVANSDFARISYTEAIEILKKNNKKFQFPVEWGVDIQTEHERYLTEVVYKKPVFVTDYPQGDQELLHEAECRRQDCGRSRYAGARHRRADRRQPA